MISRVTSWAVLERESTREWCAFECHSAILNTFGFTFKDNSTSSYNSYESKVKSAIKVGQNLRRWRQRIDSILPLPILLKGNRRREEGGGNRSCEQFQKERGIWKSSSKSQISSWKFIYRKIGSVKEEIRKFGLGIMDSGSWKSV